VGEYVSAAGARGSNVWWRGGDAPFGRLGELAVLLLVELARRRADVELKHALARVWIGQRDVDAFLEAPFDRWVELPGDVGRAEDEDARLVVADAVHLDQELCSRGEIVVESTPFDTETKMDPELCAPVLMRRDASDSPSPRVPASESISSMKMIEGLASRAI
jgi:hypothetical protein